MGQFPSPTTACTEEGPHVREKKAGLLKGFKAFLTRGNVIDLAVAVVIGAAFTDVVSSVVKRLIDPVVGTFGSQDPAKYRSCLRGPCTPNPGTGRTDGVEILWGSVLSASLSFLITGAVHFLMVLPMSKHLAGRAAARAAKAGVRETLEVIELEVPKEIRDVLTGRRGPARPPPGGSEQRFRPEGAACRAQMW